MRRGSRRGKAKAVVCCQWYRVCNLGSECRDLHRHRRGLHGDFLNKLAPKHHEALWHMQQLESITCNFSTINCRENKTRAAMKKHFHTDERALQQHADEQLAGALYDHMRGKKRGRFRLNFCDDALH